MLSVKHQEFLRENTLFSEFSDTEFTKISAQVSLCKATDQQFIFKQDQIARNFFLFFSLLLIVVGSFAGQWFY